MKHWKDVLQTRDPDYNIVTMREAIEKWARTQDADFMPPATVKELLERALVGARDEQRWVSGSWFTVDTSVVKEDPDDLYSKLDWGKLSCTSVSACAMGLLVMYSENGPVIRAWFATEEGVPISEICAQDPLISEAAVLLATAIRELQFATVPEGGEAGEWLVNTAHAYRRDPSAAVSEIVTFNDMYSGDDEDDNADRIVRAFERAVELASARDEAGPAVSS